MAKKLKQERTPIVTDNRLEFYFHFIKAVVNVSNNGTNFSS